MNHLERFLAVMEYEPVDRVPNWEVGVWPQTRERWEREGLDAASLHWRWFPGERKLGMDPKEFIAFNGDMIPLFESEVLEEDEWTVTFFGQPVVDISIAERIIGYVVRTFHLLAVGVTAAPSAPVVPHSSRAQASSSGDVPLCLSVFLHSGREVIVQTNARGPISPEVQRRMLFPQKGEVL